MLWLLKWPNELVFFLPVQPENMSLLIYSAILSAELP